MKKYLTKLLAVCLAAVMLCGVVAVGVSAEDAGTEPVDKTELIELIAEAKAIKKQGYTRSSWDKLQEIIADAQAVVDNPNATQEQVNKQTRDLQWAMSDGLQRLWTRIIAEILDVLIGITFPIWLPIAVVTFLFLWFFW